jgi:hypothetical protein
MGEQIMDRSPEGEEKEGSKVESNAERRCAVCGVKLSLYNAGPHCWQHTIGWPWRGPSAKPRF